MFYLSFLVSGYFISRATPENVLMVSAAYSAVLMGFMGNYG
jgi:hypothetical protein